MRGILNVGKDGRQDVRRAGGSRGGYAGYGGCDGWREKSRVGEEGDGSVGRRSGNNDGWPAIKY